MDTKVEIKPEIKGLFDTVRLQAEQYSDAFKIFMREKAEFMLLKNDLTQKINHLDFENSRQLTVIKETVDDSIKRLDEKSEKVINIWSELNEIIRIKSEFRVLFDNLSTDALAMKAELILLADKVHSESEQLSESINSKFDDELESLFRKLDIRLSLQSKQSEGRFNNIEKQFNKLTKELSGQISEIVDELTLLKEKTALFTSSDMLLRNELLKKVDKIESRYNSGVQEFEKFISSIEVIKNEIEKSGYVPRDIYENQVNHLSLQLRRANKSASQSNRLSTAAIVISALLTLIVIYLVLQ